MLLKVFWRGGMTGTGGRQKTPGVVCRSIERAAEQGSLLVKANGIRGQTNLFCHATNVHRRRSDAHWWRGKKDWSDPGCHSLLQANCLAQPRARWNDKPPPAFFDGPQSQSSPPSKTLSITSTESKHKQPNGVSLTGALKTLPGC